LQEFSQHGAQLHNISEQPEQNNMFDREKNARGSTLVLASWNCLQFTS